MAKRERLAQILTALANETGLKVEGGKFFDEEGEQYVIGKHGFIRAEQYALDLQVKKLSEELSDLTIMYNDLKKRYALVVLHERVLDKKSIAKVAKIIMSRVNDTEKIKQIKKYLNI